jgi:hypothetical protein
MDGAGNTSLSTPDIRSADEVRIRQALAGVTFMSNIRLTDTEIGEVLAHLRTLNTGR